MTTATIVEAFSAPRKSSWIGLGGPAPPPCTLPDASEFLAWRDAGGGWRIRESSPSGGTEKPSPEALTFFVSRRPFETCLRIVSAKSEQGNSWDCEFRGQLRVNSATNFLRCLALDWVWPDRPLTSSMLESQILQTLRTVVVDRTKSETIADMRKHLTLPLSFWQCRFDEVVEPLGMSAQLASVDWTSADADRQLAENQRQIEFARIQESSRRRAESEIVQAQLEHQHEEARRALENDSRIKAKERDHQLKQLELGFRRKRVEEELAIAELQFQSQQAALRHEVEIAKLQREKLDLETIEKRRQREEQWYAEIKGAFNQDLQTLDQLKDMPDRLVAALNGHDDGQAHQAREDLASPLHGIATASLDRLGYATGLQSLVDYFRRKSEADSHRVRVAKDELLTRDVGAGRHIKVLRIGSNLRFSLRAERSGYVTVLNLGTSGRVWLQVPSALCGLERARIAAGESQYIPGPNLFPWQDDYVELGPPGWEHMVAIVSEQPIVSVTILAASTLDEPIIELRPETWKSSWQWLREHPQSWSSGVLSFLVSAD